MCFWRMDEYGRNPPSTRVDPPNEKVTGDFGVSLFTRKEDLLKTFCPLLLLPTLLLLNFLVLT